MRSNFVLKLWQSTPARLTMVALGWLVLISWLHFHLNFETGGRTVVRMGYMPVVANLAAPLLDYVSKDGQGVRFEALKFSSFAEMGEALRNGHIQAAFIIAPLSIVLHQQKADVRVVYIGNRHESTLVYRKDLPVKTFADLAGKSIAVPMRYSGHNICARQLAEKFGLSGANLNIVEMNPPDMASALATGALDAYFVGEPFPAKSVCTGSRKSCTTWNKSGRGSSATS
jgi:NitT/TauT family transport system substrate-binding protein